jgi:hypothetical protein
VFWGLIVFFGYKLYHSIYEPVKFNKLKKERYSVVIDKLVDIRDAQLAFKEVNGEYAGNFDKLIKFIDTAQVAVTQRRDTTVRDEEKSRRFSVDMFKTITLIDTLGYYSVKDSLFKGKDTYKTLMNVPIGKPGSKFKMEAGKLDEIPVFEVSVDKKVILDGQDPNLIKNEEEIVSVDGVNGDALRVGSMQEINTTGNWPKNYRKAN